MSLVVCIFIKSSPYWEKCVVFTDLTFWKQNVVFGLWMFHWVHSSATISALLACYWETGSKIFIRRVTADLKRSWHSPLPPRTLPQSSCKDSPSAIFPVFAARRPKLCCCTCKWRVSELTCVVDVFSVSWSRAQIPSRAVPVSGGDSGLILSGATLEKQSRGPI